MFATPDWDDGDQNRNVKFDKKVKTKKNKIDSELQSIIEPQHAENKTQPEKPLKKNKVKSVFQISDKKSKKRKKNKSASGVESVIKDLNSIEGAQEQKHPRKNDTTKNSSIGDLSPNNKLIKENGTKKKKNKVKNTKPVKSNIEISENITKNSSNGVELSQNNKLNQEDGTEMKKNKAKKSKPDKPIINVSENTTKNSCSSIELSQNNKENGPVIKKHKTKKSKPNIDTSENTDNEKIKRNVKPQTTDKKRKLEEDNENVNPKKKKLNKKENNDKTLVKNTNGAQEVETNDDFIFKDQINPKKKGKDNKVSKPLQIMTHTEKKKEQIKQMLMIEKSHRNPIKTKGELLRQKMLDKLKAAQFRYLNEKLYTSTGSDAQQLFAADPVAFQTYHEGYQQQLRKWPVNPLDVIIKRISKMPKSTLIADMGCGEARLTKRLSNYTIRSFDLVATAPGVEACDMARTPLLAESMDVVVYCLALMGTNLNQYLVEANRVMKTGGLLLIAEVESRFDNPDAFAQEVEKLGFKLLKMNKDHDVFFFMEFKKIRECGKKQRAQLSLKPCYYKRR